MRSEDHGVSEIEVVQTLPRRPYPGLRPFTLDEDAIFFGREQMIDDIIDLLAQRCLILVHGSSGSGKSSLVLAGVLPRLARQHRRHGWRWRTASIRPGGGPLWNLASALAELEDDTPSAARVDELRLNFDRTGANLAKIVGQLAGMEQQRLCLLVDQFEEIFRYARETSREESRLFVDLITTALKEHSTSPVRVILTMRSEFLGECARLPGLAAVVNTAQYLLPRMETTSLQRAIRRPAELYGGDVTAELADRLIADVQGNQDELPLIQHGLMRLWDLAGEAANDKQAPRRLDLPLYEAHGPLPRLLDRHAEAVAVAAAADDSGRRVVEDIFRALTDINADGHAIRRPQDLQSLIAVSGAQPGQLVPILDAFRSDGVSFITPYAPARLRNETMIDISHEALVRCWSSLAAASDGWLHREFRDGLIWRSLLSQAEIFEKDKKKVLGPATTEDRQAWLNDRTPAWSERYGGGWSRVQRLMTASLTADKRDKRLRFSTWLIASSIILSMLLLFIYWQHRNSDELRLNSTVQAELIQDLGFLVSKAGLPGSRQAQERRAILDSATRSAETLADMVKGRPEYKIMLITLFNALSDLAYDAEDWEKAEKTAKAAQSLVQPLVNDSPSDLNLQQLLYQSTSLLGDAFDGKGTADRAEGEYQHALNIAKELVRLTNGDPKSNHDEAIIEPKLGDMCSIREDTDCALAHYRNALAINQRLLGELANDDAAKADVQQDLADNMVRIGDVLSKKKMMVDDALNQYQSAAEIDEKLVKDNPNDPLYQANLARVYDQIADIRERHGDLPAVMNLYQKSLKLGRSLAVLDPSNNRWLAYLAMEHSKMGDILVRLVRTDDSRGRTAGGAGLDVRTADAITNYKSAEKVLDMLVTTMPEKSDWMQQSSEVAQKLIRLLLSQAETVCRSKGRDIKLCSKAAVNLRSKIAQNSPDYALQHRELAVAYVMLGDVFKAIGDNADSIEQYQEARSIIDNFTSTHPNDSSVQALKELRQDVCKKDSGLCP